MTSAGKFFSKEGKAFGALLHGRARALCIPRPSPIAFEANTFASGQGGRGEQGRGTAASFAKPGLFLCTLPLGLSASIPPSIPPCGSEASRGTWPASGAGASAHQQFSASGCFPLNSLTAKAFILEKTGLHPRLVRPCCWDLHTSG